MRVMGKHLWRDVARDTHDGGIARVRLGQFGNCMMPQVVEAEPCQWTLYLADARST